MCDKSGTICFYFFIFSHFALISYDLIIDPSTTSAITYTLNGGRFGDDLASLTKAEWLSYKYDIPLLYKPFQYSDQLMLHELEIARTDKLCTQFKKVMKLPQSGRINIKKDAGILYISHFFLRVRPDWKDEKFVSKLRKIIAPRSEIDLV